MVVDEVEVASEWQPYYVRAARARPQRFRTTPSVRPRPAAIPTDQPLSPFQ